MAEIGSVIAGKYEILTEIGHGGMSVVYLAMDTHLNKQWAVKEIRKKGNGRNDEVIVNSLLAEANMMKRLDHPSLPRIVDIIDNGVTIFVVMDYIEGESLDKILAEYGAQPEELVVGWAKQLCDALSYLHSQKPPIIYRDMKPANVMLKPEGNIKIIDFGIAREYKEQNLADTTVLGTKGYAPPEQYSGQTDARSDIFALGMTMHHLLTGIDPRTGEAYAPVRMWNPEVSEGVEMIIDKCVQPAPENRYQNCQDLLYDLEHPELITRDYKKKQKIKLNSFVASIVLAIVCVISGVVCNRVSVNMNNGDYEVLVSTSTAYVYDAENQLVEVIEPDGAKTKKTYDRDGNLVAVTNAMDHVTSYTYDDLGRRISRTNAEGATTSLFYNNMGQVERVCHPNGTQTFYTYDLGGRVKSVKNPDGSGEIYEYDLKGNLISRANGMEDKISFKYDALDRLVEIVNQVEGVRKFTYDAVGNLTSIIDEKGNKTTYDYSPNGNLMKVTDALGNETFYEYDAMNRLVKTLCTGANGEESQNTDFVWDVMGQIKSVTDPLGYVESYEYDKNGNMTSKTDRDGYTINFTYGSHGKIEEIVYADGKTVEMSYDALRRLNEVKDWNGITKITLDAIGRALSVTEPNGDTVGYEWGLMGEKKAVIGLTLLSKHSIKFKDWFEKDMMKLYNLTPPEDINNTERFVIYRPNFYKGVSIVTVLVFLGFLIMTIVVADNRPDLYLFWVVCLVFSVISAIHTCTYKYTIENRKIRYKWLFGKEKVIAFSEIDKITLEGSPNSECGVIYKKGVKKPFMKIRMIDKNANRFRYLNIK